MTEVDFKKNIIFSGGYNYGIKFSKIAYEC